MKRALFLLLAGCSSLDPTVGALYGDKPSTEDDGATPPPPPPDDAATFDAPELDEDGNRPDVDRPEAERRDANADAREASGGVSFRRDIRPLMNRAANDPTGKGCKNCHYSTEASHQGIDLGGLDLATLGALREGGGSTGRRIVVPGKPDESGLLQKLRGTFPYGTRMPKNGPPFWSDADMKLVVDWIAQGAQGADDE